MGIKVFDLQLLVGRENIMGDKPRICVESVETCGKNLYVGTNDCFMHHYALQVPSEHDEHRTFSVKRQGKKHIGMKKPIIQIKAAAALNHLLVNCDSTLMLLSMLDLSISTSVSGKVRNMNKFCVNERPMNRNPFSIEICVSFLKKKSLQIYQVNEDSIVPMHEVSLPEHPRNLCVDERYICVGTASAYLMVNSENGSRQELFSLGDDNQNLRMISRVGPSEFLITATNALGVFVLSDGTSNRPPLQWSEGVFATEISHPYIIALDDEFITVHSLLDQQQKQSLPFQGGALISRCDGGVVVVCTPKDIFILVPVPLQTQLNTLLADRQLDEALSLIKVSRRKLTQDRYNTMLNRVYSMSGFVRFQELDFDNAIMFFNDGGMDPRELISLFPQILPNTSVFKRSVPPLHDIADIRQMCNNDKAQILHCQEFLSLYLEMVCDELFTHSLTAHEAPKFVAAMDSAALDMLSSDVFYATVLIFAELGKTVELQHFIEMKSSKSASTSMLDMISAENSSDLLNGLKRCGCHHMCALIHLKTGEVESAMKIWQSIVSRQVSDPTFPGLMYVTENLPKFCQDQNLLWQNAEWILEEDQQAGVKIFTNQYSSAETPNNTLQPDDVVNFLHQYPDAIMEYLYHLVMVEKVQREKFHTHLAVLCLERVLALKSSPAFNPDELVKARRKLQDILNQSDLYRIHLIMGKTKDADLFQEQVILHSKLGEHNKALEILVHKEGNPVAAKEYCLLHSENDTMSRQQLFHNLLSVYLQDITARKGATDSTVAVIDLLNKHSEDFEPESVLHVLPTQWSISVLTKFLHNSLRVPLHDLRTKSLEYMLVKSQILQLQRQHKVFHSLPVIIQEGKICQVCNRLLSEGAFVRYPNGIIVHTHCSKDKHICPVTGKIFKMKKKPLPNGY